MDAEVFAAYECKSLPSLGNVHPGDISEPGLLAAVSLPLLTYGSEAFQGEVIDDTMLSRLQLEGVSGVQVCKPSDDPIAPQHMTVIQTTLDYSSHSTVVSTRWWRPSPASIDTLLDSPH